MLELAGITAGYGDALVLRGVDLTAPDGQVVALLGPNGAGKSTLLRTATGFVRARSGSIRYGGRDLTRRPPHEFARAGICHIPEGRGVFPSLSVAENLRVQAGSRPIEEVVAEVTALFPALSNKLGQNAGQLSGGEQQMLALSRAYVTRPDLVLVDEPSLGLAPLVVDKIFDALRVLVERGISVVVVDQYVQRALDLADIVCILSRGQVVHTGPARQVAAGEIYEMYLGIDA